MSVSALSAFLMTTFVCGKYIGGGGWCCEINSIHTHNAKPVYYGVSVRQGIHNPSCRSVATDKGDVLRPLLIHHSGKGRYYTCCLHIIALGWKPHTHLKTHMTGCTCKKKTGTNSAVHRQAHTNPTNLYTYSHCEITNKHAGAQTHSVRYLASLS